MLSRVAENLYWMARYIERAENTARLINATSQVLLDMPRGASFGWDVLTRVAGIDRLFDESYETHDEASIMRFLIVDPSNPSSILSCAQCARENSRRLRDVLPRAFWERVNAMYLGVRARAERLNGRADRQRMLEEIIQMRQSVAGLLSECMSHDAAYHLVRLGEYVERADMTTRIVDIHTAVLVPQHPRTWEDPSVALLWVGVLKSLSAFQMYRRHGEGRIHSAGVVSYLLKDSQFPRSVRFCLHGIESHLAELPHNATSLRALRTAQRRIDAMKLEGLAPHERHEYLDAVQGDLANIDREISQGYFHLDDRRAEPLRAAGG